MMNLNFLIIPLATSLLVYMLDFAFGHPSEDKWHHKEIMSFYPLWLAKNKLKKYNLYYDLHNQLIQNLKNAITNSDRFLINEEFKKIVYDTGKQYFTWEYAAGMCPICFGFWVNFITSSYFFLLIDKNISTFILSLLVGHLFTRLLNKYG